MALYSESIHKKIDEKLKEAKELFKSSESVSVEEKESKFNELVELFKEKYGTNYLSYMTSFFLEPAIFVKVTDSFREAHMNDEEEEDSNGDEEDSNDEEEDSNEDEEDSNEDEEENSNENEEDSNEDDEEDCDDACDVIKKRENKSSDSDSDSDSELDLDSEEKFKAMFEKLSAEMGDDEKKFLEKLLKGEKEEGEEEEGSEDEEEGEEEGGEEEEEEGEEEGGEEEEEEGESNEESDEGEDEEGEEENSTSEAEENNVEYKEYIENIMDVVPVQEVSFMMMMLFGLDKDEEEKFTTLIKENEEKQYTIQQNPYYLNNQKAKFNKFIYKRICKLSKEAEKEKKKEEESIENVEAEESVKKEEDISLETVD